MSDYDLDPTLKSVDTTKSPDEILQDKFNARKAEIDAFYAKYPELKPAEVVEKPESQSPQGMGPEEAKLMSSLDNQEANLDNLQAIEKAAMGGKSDGINNASEFTQMKEAGESVIVEKEDLNNNFVKL